MALVSRAIVASRDMVAFLFDKLDGGDPDGTEAQLFFADNPLFPYGFGVTPSNALKDLDRKLGLLYELRSDTGSRDVKAIPKFELRARHDVEPNEPTSWYEVSWDDVVSDLRGSGRYFYEDAKDSATETVRRNLHALLQFKYVGPFLQL